MHLIRIGEGAAAQHTDLQFSDFLSQPRGHKSCDSNEYFNSHSRKSLPLINRVSGTCSCGNIDDKSLMDKATAKE